MASITIQKSHKNLLLAAALANDTGATFEEDGDWITISDNPDLVIPRHCFSEALDPDGQRRARGDPHLASAWRSLLLNRNGYLKYFGDVELILTDTKPSDPRPQFLLRFPDAEAKARAEVWAERSGYDTLTAFILDAIIQYCSHFESHAPS